MKLSYLEVSSYRNLPHVMVSLLDRHGNLPQISGLNWGQRPQYHREPNQAYIRLPASVYRSNFFPSKPIRFTLITDDNQQFICTRAQANGKAIHTPENNSSLGKYFRNRLGIPLGCRVSTQDLLAYGRSDIDFFKIDDNTFVLDFGVPTSKS